MEKFYLKFVIYEKKHNNIKVRHQIIIVKPWMFYNKEKKTSTAVSEQWQYFDIIVSP
jgi:hypothetical protein